MSEPYRTPYADVASVVKTIGLSGEVVACAADGLSLRLRPGMDVFLVPPVMKGVNHAVIDSVTSTGGSGRVRFEGVDDLDGAEGLIGRHILASRSDLGDMDGRLSVIGREVVCVDHGPLGCITSLIETPANDVWDVDGPYGEVLIPVIDEVVLDRPVPAEGPIRVRLLPGLLDSEAVFIDEDGDGGYGE